MSDISEPFNLDEDIDRRVVPALKVHPMVVGPGGEGQFAADVADMDFKAPPPVLDALQSRLEHGVFGYEVVPDGLFPALRRWLHVRHGWDVDQSHILRAPNILNALAIAASLFTRQGDGVIVQPPVFFDFFNILRENRRALISNPLILEVPYQFLLGRSVRCTGALPRQHCEIDQRRNHPDGPQQLCDGSDGVPVHAGTSDREGANRM